MKKRKKLLEVSLASLMLVSSASALASAFQSFEQNASDLGNAFAGSAALAPDASTEFSNPAAMTRFKENEISVSTVMVAAHAHFRATEATNASGNDVLSTADETRENPLGLNPLPSIHLVLPSGRWAFGFGITVPFGYKTDYSRHNAARYYATESSIKAFNFGPSIAYQVNRKLSVAAGFDWQYLIADLNQQVDLSPFLVGKSTGEVDATLKNHATGWGWGAHAGLLFNINPSTRFGFMYRSPVYFYKPEGRSRISYPGGLTEDQLDDLASEGLKDSDIDTHLILSQTMAASLYHAFNRKWSMMGTIGYTHWRRLQDLTIRFHSNLPEASVKQHFHNVFRYALGVNYCYNRHWLFRLGWSYDNAPTDNHWRTIRLPDADRIWWAAGLKYTYNKHLSVDLGYVYIHIKGGRAKQTGPLSTSVAGEYDNTYANLFGLQLNWKFLTT